MMLHWQMMPMWSIPYIEAFIACGCKDASERSGRRIHRRMPDCNTRISKTSARYRTRASGSIPYHTHRDREIRGAEKVRRVVLHVPSFLWEKSANHTAGLERRDNMSKKTSDVQSILTMRKENSISRKGICIRTVFKVAFRCLEYAATVMQFVQTVWDFFNKNA
jgi:hypothetical protein